MATALLAWIGNADLRAAEEGSGEGPIAKALAARKPDVTYLLSDFGKSRTNTYVKWLRSRLPAKVIAHFRPLSSPTNFAEIYEAAGASCTVAVNDEPKPLNLVFHLSPGTPAMAAVWIILGKTRFPAELIQSSPERGVETASVPFDISADFLPDLLRSADEKLELAAAAPTSADSTFGEILYRSAAMRSIITRAKRVATRDVPVLIEGESGTGKELLARAIHAHGGRRAKPFIGVNCGAIPRELVESHLFGHERGAFTGADRLRPGYFEQASGGTIFLDEIGELPLDAQVKLLRVLQEREVTRVGASRPLPVDVRVIAATNRQLTDEIRENRFRADLFFRIAVAVLRLPPLRDRKGDLSLLTDSLFEKLNGEAASQAGVPPKKLSAAARNVLLGHGWPGNVRELINTLQRMIVWTEGTTIGAEDAREALISFERPGSGSILDRPLGEGLDLRTLLREVSVHYLERAIEEARGNKTEAAKLLGLPSYQTLTNWLDRYQVATRR